MKYLFMQLCYIYANDSQFNTSVFEHALHILAGHINMYIFILLDVLIISCVLFYDFIIDIYDMIVNNFNMKIIISNWQSH